MSAFLSTVSGQQPTPTLVAERPKAVSDDKPKRGPGRPPKPLYDLAKQTAIRLDPEDLRRLKKLAVDDDMTFNRLVYLALRDYCGTRGVKLVGTERK
jgi:hypothetical protein